MSRSFWTVSAHYGSGSHLLSQYLFSDRQKLVDVILQRTKGLGAGLSLEKRLDILGWKIVCLQEKE